jgi:hypothetical protein
MFGPHSPIGVRTDLAGLGIGHGGSMMGSSLGSGDHVMDFLSPSIPPIPYIKPVKPTYETEYQAAYSPDMSALRKKRIGHHQPGMSPLTATPSLVNQLREDIEATHTPELQNDLSDLLSALDEVRHKLEDIESKTSSIRERQEPVLKDIKIIRSKIMDIMH